MASTECRPEYYGDRMPIGLTQDHLEYLFVQMDDAVQVLGSKVNPAKWMQLTGGGQGVYHFEEKTAQQAILVKCARMVSLGRAAALLLKHGFLQEQVSLQRSLEETSEDVTCLCIALRLDDQSDVPRKLVEGFFSEQAGEIFCPGPRRKRPPNVKRPEVRDYLNRSIGFAVEDQDPGKVLYALGSGYAHGAAAYVMEMYYGRDPAWHLAGQLDSPLYADHAQDIWHYAFRALAAVTFACRALGDEELFARLLPFMEEVRQRVTV
jgi:hypothetical protein